MESPVAHPSPSPLCRFTRRHRVAGGEGTLSRSFRRALGLASLLGLGLLLSCAKDDRVTGSASDTETGTAAGILVLKGGGAAQGARVSLFPAGEDAGKADSTGYATVTDASGAYTFDSLRFDTYNLTASYVPAGTQDTLAASRLSIRVAGDDRNVQLGTDTLRGPGAVSARVMFLSDPVEEALCYVPGTSYMATTDSAGHCLVSGIPPGRYRLSFKADGYLARKAADSVQVATDDTVRLGEVRLELNDELAPPRPNGLKAAFDTATRKVALSWSKVPAKDLEGYALYRDSVQAVTFTRIAPDRLVRDSAYADSLPWLRPGMDTLLAYRIKAQDRSGEQSRFGLFETVRVRLPRTYRPPEAPFNPTPMDGLTHAGMSLALKWSARDPDGDSLEADIFLGKDSLALPRIAQGLRDTVHLAGSLEPMTAYYWRVALTDGRDTTLGPVWRFTTGTPPAGAWTQLGDALQHVIDLRFVDKDKGWAVGASGSISRTRDGGLTWTAQNSGTSAWLNAVHFTDSLRGWAVGDSTTVLRTLDGGASWTRLEMPGSAFYYDVHFQDALHGWVVGGINSGNGSPLIHWTEDGGATWTDQKVEDCFHIRAISFPTQDTGYAMGHYFAADLVVYKTVDRGRNWLKLDSVNLKSPFAMHFIGTDTGWIGGTTLEPNQEKGLVARTVDGGRNWTVVEVPDALQIESLMFQDGKVGWAVGNTVYRTGDGGITWRPENIQTPPFLRVYFNLDRDHGWAAGGSGALYRRPPLP